ncbi:hypothetical protein E0W68_02245 [Flavobacterium salilacus subsp. salilacus]|uniref:hypothetical protein n=1 Tax=Flavobacterium TaxID=237 RepID=UPI0010751740|nr:MULTISPECIES: hypothetical protein [Flavobacterium]KAF2520063.1 hypothetical protein E0W68_02245 [Flavobacterium salilacus subsp. salilacus]MBE1614021.1 hypothetical protein [Flavobacterium sp. SaA2.13]
MKSLKNEKRYIPQPLKELLLNSQYKRKDDLYCIIDLIYRKQVYFKNDLQKQYGYCEIARASFLKFIPDPHNVKAAIDYLVEQGYIMRNDFFVYGVKAKGYKVSKEYLGTKVAVEITDPKMNIRIKKEKLSLRKKRVTNLEFQKSRYYKTFKINENEALQAAKDKAMGQIKTLLLNIKYRLSDSQISDVIDCKGNHIKSRNMILQCEGGNQLHSILHRLMIHQQQIYAIADGWLYFKRNSTNGRLDSNLTSLPSYLRKFIISDETLYNIDIKNSQPYFLYTRLRNEPTVDKNEVEHYGELAVSGQLYEYIADKFKDITGKTKDREQTKRMLFKIFYSKITSFQSYKNVFRNIFPSIMEYIDTTNTDKHNTLAVAMQTMESHAILDVVMPACKAVGITPLTIHDSFIVAESEASTVRDIFENEFKKMFGLVPALHYQNIFETENDDCEDDIDFEDILSDFDDKHDNNEIIETIYLDDRQKSA